jgi:hypothetical protein
MKLLKMAMGVECVIAARSQRELKRKLKRPGWDEDGMTEGRGGQDA